MVKQKNHNNFHTEFLLDIQIKHNYSRLYFNKRTKSVVEKLNGAQDTPEKTINAILTPLHLIKRLREFHPYLPPRQLQYAQRTEERLKHKLNKLLQKPAYRQYQPRVDSILGNNGHTHQEDVPPDTSF